jgi:hypothetical protein
LNAAGNCFYIDEQAGIKWQTPCDTARSVCCPASAAANSDVRRNVADFRHYTPVTNQKIWEPNRVRAFWAEPPEPDAGLCGGAGVCDGPELGDGGGPPEDPSTGG